MESRIDVRIMVTCYNYEKYIADCLDGIFMQKCNFSFQVVVFDDVSDDSSWKIIQTYHQKYADKLIAIQPEKNTYQNGDACGGLIEIGKMPPTKYIAFCEGDDYWTDPYKLQKQYDIMEKNPQCSICVCDVELYDVYNDRIIGMAPDGYKNCWSKDEIINRILTYRLSIRENSIFARAESLCGENFSDSFWNYWACDLTKIIHFLLHGDLIYIHENMTRKRVNNTGSLSHASNTGQNTIDWQIKQFQEYIAWINYFDKLSEYHYHDMVRYYISFREIKIHYLKEGKLQENRWVSNVNGRMYKNGFLRKINRLYTDIIRDFYHDNICNFVKVSANWMEKELNRLCSLS